MEGLPAPGHPAGAPEEKSRLAGLRELNSGDINSRDFESGDINSRDFDIGDFNWVYQIGSRIPSADLINGQVERFFAS